MDINSSRLLEGVCQPNIGSPGGGTSTLRPNDARNIMDKIALVSLREHLSQNGSPGVGTLTLRLIIVLGL